MIYKRKKSYYVLIFGFAAIFSCIFLAISLFVLPKNLAIGIFGSVFFLACIIALFKQSKEIEIKKDCIIASPIALFGKKKITKTDEIKIGTAPRVGGMNLVFYSCKKAVGGISHLEYFEEYKKMLRQIEQTTKVKIYQNPIANKIIY